MQRWAMNPTGRLLTTDDLDRKQTYFLAKPRRHNRFLHGWGVMAGLEGRQGDQRAWWMSGSETIASLWGVSRPSPMPSSYYAALADPKPQRFDV